MNTQLSSPEMYDVNQMVFSKAIKGSAKTGEGEPQIKFSRIMISTQNGDGSIGELIFPTSELFSFGVSTNTAQDGSGKIAGYSLPLCLWNKDAPLPIEKAFSSKLEEIVEKCKDHLLLDSTKEETEKYDLERTELKKLNSFIYWKRDKGKIVEGTGPTLYPKLIESKKNNKIITTLFDSQGNEINHMDLIGKFCFIKAAIKIESIFIGAKIALQVKVYEAEVRMVESGTRRLLPRPKADSIVSVAQKSIGASLPFSASPNPIMANDHIIDDDDDDNNDDDEMQTDVPSSVVAVSTPPVGLSSLKHNLPNEAAPQRKAIRTVTPKKK